MYDLINIKKFNRTAVVEINNPPANALGSLLADEILESFQQLEKDASVHVVILKGAGEKFFIAGADIKEFPKWIHSEGLVESVNKNHEVIRYIENYCKPTIAFLNGLTLGGGLEVALAFDLRFAESHAKLGVPEINLGIFPGAGGTQRLTKIIGKARAIEMMYLGNPISAEKAHSYGLLNDVFPTGSGFEKVLEIAQQISDKSKKALSDIKEVVLFGEEHSFIEAIEHEKKLFIDIFKHPDAAEGIEAFIEKRKPNFNP